MTETQLWSTYALTLRSELNNLPIKTETFVVFSTNFGNGIAQS